MSGGPSIANLVARRQANAERLQQRNRNLFGSIIDPGTLKVHVSSHGHYRISHPTTSGATIGAKKLTIPPGVTIFETGSITETVFQYIDKYLENLFTYPDRLKKHLFNMSGSDNDPVYYKGGERVELRNRFDEIFKDVSPVFFQGNILRGNYTEIIGFAESLYTGMGDHDLYMKSLVDNLEMYETAFQNIYPYTQGEEIFERSLTAYTTRIPGVEPWADLFDSTGRINYLKSPNGKYSYDKSLATYEGTTYGEILKDAERKVKPIIIIISTCASTNIQGVQPAQLRLIDEIEKLQANAKLSLADPSFRVNNSGVDITPYSSVAVTTGLPVRTFNWYFDGCRLIKTEQGMTYNSRQEYRKRVTGNDMNISHTEESTDWIKHEQPDGIVWFEGGGAPGPDNESDTFIKHLTEIGERVEVATRTASLRLVPLLEGNHLYKQREDILKRHIKLILRQINVTTGADVSLPDILDPGGVGPIIISGTGDNCIVRYQPDSDLWSSKSLIVSGLINKDFWDMEYYLNPSEQLQKISSRLRKAGFETYEKFDAARQGKKEINSKPDLWTLYFDINARTLLETEHPVEPYDSFIARNPEYTDAVKRLDKLRSITEAGHIQSNEVFIRSLGLPPITEEVLQDAIRGTPGSLTIVIEQLNNVSQYIDEQLQAFIEQLKGGPGGRGGYRRRASKYKKTKRKTKRRKTWKNR